MMITKKMKEALNGQVNKEFYAAYLYLAMGAKLEEMNLKGMASWMKAQAHEEIGHGLRIFNFVHERGGDVTLPAIAAPKFPGKAPLDFFKAAYAHEQKVTGWIHDLVSLAEKEKDRASAAMLQWYVTEQVEEEDQTLEIVQKLEMVRGSAQGLLMIDAQLGQRKDE